MLVDDDDITRHAISSILKENGFSVSEARNGIEALEILESNVPSLMLLDLMMPEMNGIELLNRIRNNKHLKDIPVILLSAIDLTEEQELWLKGNTHQVFISNHHKNDSLLTSIKKVLGEVTDESDKIKNIG